MTFSFLPPPFFLRPFFLFFLQLLFVFPIFLFLKLKLQGTVSPIEHAAATGSLLKIFAACSMIATTNFLWWRGTAKVMLSKRFLAPVGLKVGLNPLDSTS